MDAASAAIAREKPVSIDGLLELAKPDMAKVDALIRDRMQSPVSVIPALAEHLIGGSAKRLRPLLTIAAARVAGAQDDACLKLAAAVEFIHTATLLHDDVVDASSLRRGRDTANEIFGNEASVLVGDFLYSRAFQMMVSLGAMPIMDVMANATNTIAEGEVLQLMNAHDPETTEQRYLDVIHRKTARLFEAGAQVAAIVAGASPSVQQQLAAYGRHLGTAFQLVDDALDYSGDATELGKNLGDDLAEGKPTLPLIHALRSGTPAQAAMIRHAIEHGGLEDLTAIRAAIESTGGLQYTARLARSEADRALAALGGLPESAYREALASLAEFAVTRRH